MSGFTRVARRAAAVALSLAFTSYAAAGESVATPNEATAALKDAIAARLLLMDDVARYKWNAGLPIRDAARESSLLEGTIDEAVALGIPRDYAQRVVAAQIEASRELQQAAMDQWRAEHRGRFTDVPELVSVQRPAIERATATLLTQLRDVMCDLDAQAADALAAPPSQLAAAARAWSIAVDALLPPPDECRQDESR